MSESYSCGGANAWTSRENIFSVGVFLAGISGGMTMPFGGICEIFHYLIFSSIFPCANYLQCQSSFIILKVRINLSWLFMACWCYIVSWVKHLHVIFCCLFSLRLSAGFYQKLLPKGCRLCVTSQKRSHVDIKNSQWAKRWVSRATGKTRHFWFRVSPCFQQAN